ncbi:MAG: CDGSH iron-sulfur domain-containing protein [Chloroflexaceae bacterium]|nr:CDGSH iron-sulfur domain-containing protein [Chloroflexaceae bacterium]
MAEETLLSLKNNGPIIIEGNFRIMMADGNEVMVEGTRAALCRCGMSANKPFCDGAHARNQWKAENPAPAPTEQE